MNIFWKANLKPLMVSWNSVNKLKLFKRSTGSEGRSGDPRAQSVARKDSFFTEVLWISPMVFNFHFQNIPEDHQKWTDNQWNPDHKIIPLKAWFCDILAKNTAYYTFIPFPPTISFDLYFHLSWFNIIPLCWCESPRLAHWDKTFEFAEVYLQNKFI